MNTTIIGLDPGTVRSALVTLSADGTVTATLDSNATILAAVWALADQADAGELVIEQIASYGMAVGAEIFETCYWSGRFAEAWARRRGTDAHRLPRLAVKVALCHDSRAKDANIRQALIDRFGGPSCIRKGGPLYKLHGDEWAALAVAVTFHTQQDAERL
ncbi:MAG: hypothetical protein NTV05_08350 [Acidobacteria bacterium]|nr:hypothetical protein [Acidobacteriota bacterium]